jgi:hypothetical protein
VVNRVVGPLKICVLRGGKKSQLELKKLYEPAEFKLPEQYAQMLNTCFSALFFCSGMPALLHVAALDLGLLYLTDRWLFYSAYRKPPAYDEALAVQASAALRWALPLHLLMAMWAFTAEFVQSGELGLFSLLVRPVPRTSAAHVTAVTRKGLVQPAAAVDGDGGFGRLLERVLGRSVGVPLLAAFAGLAAYEVLRRTMGWWLGPLRRLCTRGQKVSPWDEGNGPSEVERMLALGYIKAVRARAEFECHFCRAVRRVAR